MSGPRSIDIETLKVSVDLATLIGIGTNLRKVAATGGGEYAGPCPFCGGKDRFRVQPARGRWWCRQCSTNEKWGDCIDYVMRHDNLSFLEACKWLQEWSGVNPATRAPATSAAVPALRPSNKFTMAALLAASECEANLRRPTAEPALAYLRRDRGLTNDTIRSARLGFNPAVSIIAGLRVPAGITIPWITPDSRVWQIKVRRLAADKPKYLSVRWADSDCQSEAGHPLIYGADSFRGHDSLVLTEGEFDCMLVRQEAGDVVDVATLGSASQTVGGAWEYLLSFERILVAYDNDDQGNLWARRLIGRYPRTHRVRVPSGNDITDFWKTGGGLRQWIAAAVPPTR